MLRLMRMLYRDRNLIDIRHRKIVVFLAVLSVKLNALDYWFVYVSFVLTCITELIWTLWYFTIFRSISLVTHCSWDISTILFIDFLLINLKFSNLFIFLISLR
jgi:hypothetical protein